MKFFMPCNLILLVALNFLWSNLLSSQITSVNLYSNGEIRYIFVETDNGVVGISGDFKTIITKTEDHDIRKNSKGLIEQVDYTDFEYTYDGKIEEIENEDFDYRSAYSSNGEKLSSINRIDFSYHTSGNYQGMLRSIENESIYYYNGTIRGDSTFLIDDIYFVITANIPKEASCKENSTSSSGSLSLNSALAPIIANGTILDDNEVDFMQKTFLFADDLTSSSYEYSNYYRVKKQRQVFKFRGNICFRVEKTNDDNLVAESVDCGDFLGNYLKVRDEILVLRYDDKVCFSAELIDKRYLISEKRDCPNGKERYRLRTF